MTVASSALALTAFAAPAHATEAGSGDYAASVATSITSSANAISGPGVKVTVKLDSTDLSKVDELHGKIIVVVTNPRKNDKVKFSAIKAISGDSGTTYTLKKNSGFPQAPGKSFDVTAVFVPTSNHIESGASSEYSFNY